MPVIPVYMNFFLIASTNTNMSWNPTEVDDFTVFRDIIITVLYIHKVWLVDIDIIKRK